MWTIRGGIQLVMKRRKSLCGDLADLRSAVTVVCRAWRDSMRVPNWISWACVGRLPQNSSWTMLKCPVSVRCALTSTDNNK